jgi:uncharacterized protein
MKRSWIPALAGIWLLFAPAWLARAEIPVPKLTAHVMDSTGTLTVPERDSLESKLASFERAKGSQVAVLIVPSLDGEAIEDFAGRVTDEWKLGRKGVDDGVLFVVAKRERKMRIHTGRGVQGTLTDALSRRIIADIVAPRFRSGDFAGGIDAGANAIMKAIEGESLPLPSRKSASPKVDTISSYSDFLWIAFFAVPIVGMVLRGVLGRALGAGATSSLTGVAAWLAFDSVIFGGVAALLAFLFTLFLGSSAASRVGRGGPWIGGGGFGGGGGFSSGGGGGFSGGGGGFDGGGSSGSW